MRPQAAMILRTHCMFQHNHMPQALVQIVFKQVIDISSTGEFARNVFDDSFSEFQLQAQAYNPEGKFRTFQELTAHNPKANSLHYKVGFSIGLFVKELKNVIPGLADSLGRPVSFSSYQFELVESDITQKSLHKVAITYETNILTLFATVGDFLILAVGDRLQESNQMPVDTFLLRVQPNVSIASWQRKSNDLTAALLRQAQSN
jgi:hypothetical protein